MYARLSQVASKFTPKYLILTMDITTIRFIQTQLLIYKMHIQQTTVVSITCLYQIIKEKIHYLTKITQTNHFT